MSKEVMLDCYFQDVDVPFTNIKNLKEIGYGNIKDKDKVWVEIASREPGISYSETTKVEAVKESFETIIYVSEELWQKLGGVNKKLIKVVISIPKGISYRFGYYLKSIYEKSRKPKNIAKVIGNILQFIISFHILPFPWNYIISIIILVISILV